MSRLEGERLVQALERVRGQGVQIAYTIIASTIYPVQKYLMLSLITFGIVMGIFALRAITTGYTYSATASLLLSPPAYLQKGPASDLMPKPLDIPSYARLLTDDAILKAVCDNVYEKDPKLWEKMKQRNLLVPDVIKKLLGMKTEVVEKTPQRVVYSQVIRLSAVAGKPEQAKALADAWTEVGLNAIQKYTVPSSEATVEFIRTEFDKAKTELAAKEESLRQQKVAWNVPRLKLLKENSEKELAALRDEHNETLVKKAQAEQELKAIQENIAKETATRVLRRSPSVDAIAIIESGGKRPTDIPMLSDEIVNNVWEYLRGEETTTAARYQGLTAKADELSLRIESLDKEITTLNDNYVTQDIKEKQFLREVYAATDYFNALAKLREQVAALDANAKMERAGTVSLANAAVAPTKPNNLITRWASIPAGFLIALLAAVAVANGAYEIHRVNEKRRDELQAETKVS